MERTANVKIGDTVYAVSVAPTRDNFEVSLIESDDTPWLGFVHDNGVNVVEDLAVYTDMPRRTAAAILQAVRALLQSEGWLRD